MSRQSNWETTTILSLFTGYAGYYVCRSVLSVAAPQIVSYLVEQGMDREQAVLGIANVASLAVIFYAIGKLFGGIICEYVGGRRMFLLGMAASVACTIAFGLSSGLFAFTIAFCINRIFQSTGWSALVKVTSSWFSFQTYGRVMGWLCLSYLVGDFLARKYLSLLLDVGFDWRQLFFAAAGMLAVIAVACMFTIRSSPRDLGLAAPAVNPANLYGERGNEERPEGIFDLLKPLLGSFAFWMVCIMSLGLSMIRETFNFWLPIYFSSAGNVTDAQAANYSAYFPLFGAFSVILSGYLTDFLGGKRGTYMMVSLVLLTAVLFGLTQVQGTSSLFWPLTFIYAIGFLMLAPYAFLTGAISLDLGGKRASSTAAGLIDAVGYLGSSLALRYAATLSNQYGWNVVFGTMAALAAASAFAALLYAWDLERRRVTPQPEIVL